MTDTWLRVATALSEIVVGNVSGYGKAVVG